MKISISYPPLESKKGTPCLSQNRQFQWFSKPTYIFPVVPAYAASLLKQKGYDVFWDDGIAEGLTYEEWKIRLKKEEPDIIAIETKTPVVKRHWKIIEDIRNLVKESRIGKCEICSEAVFCKSHKIGTTSEGWNPKIVLMGDHITALPEESLKKSSVDFVIACGDYDFMLLKLANHLQNGEPLGEGFWFRENGKNTSSGSVDILKHDLDHLPYIDRKLTNWKLYAYKNGNFKRTPGTHMMIARDCWWGQCSFCSWTTMFPGHKFRTRSVKKALHEVEKLIDLGAKEIMDDSGSFPVGEWLTEFCEGMIKQGYNKKVRINCNMRINGIKNPDTWRLMKKAGFRLILFGLESANQKTLDKINKNLRIEEIEPGLKMCKEAGLEPHITAMVGYPWETKEDAQRTINLAKGLFKKGFVDTLQATIVIPYPGTPLYKYCKENDLLLTEDYNKFDQREQIMKSPLATAEVKKLTRSLYTSFMSPSFILRTIFSIRRWSDIKFIFSAALQVFSHLLDFSRNKEC